MFYCTLLIYKVTCETPEPRSISFSASSRREAFLIINALEIGMCWGDLNITSLEIDNIRQTPQRGVEYKKVDI